MSIRDGDEKKRPSGKLNQIVQDASDETRPGRRRSDGFSSQDCGWLLLNRLKEISFKLINAHSGKEWHAI
jgi:hypothetical protein